MAYICNASSPNFSHPPRFMVDGSHDTHWQAKSDSDPANITIDLRSSTQKVWNLWTVLEHSSVWFLEWNGISTTRNYSYWALSWSFLMVWYHLSFTRSYAYWTVPWLFISFLLHLIFLSLELDDARKFPHTKWKSGSRWDWTTDHCMSEMHHPSICKPDWFDSSMEVSNFKSLVSRQQ